MNKLERLQKSIPNIYNPTVNKNVLAVLSAWAVGDESTSQAILDGIKELFVETADGQFLTYLGANVGVERPLQIALSDVFFRQLIEKLSYAPKQVQSTMYDVLDIFWGPTYSRANVTSTNTETYNLGNITTLTGQVIFTNGLAKITGIGTFFTIELAVGKYIRYIQDSNEYFVKVINIVNNTQAVISSPYKGKTVTGQAQTYTPLNLQVQVDDTKTTYTFPLNPIYFINPNQATAQEVANAITGGLNKVTGSVVKTNASPKPFVNIRTNTTGSLGMINVIGGTANAVIGFPTGPNIISDLVKSTIIYEINPREIVLLVPNLVAKLERSLKGVIHIHNDVTGIITAVDNGAKTVTANLSRAVLKDELKNYSFTQGLLKFSILGNTAGTNGVVLTLENTDISPILITTFRALNPKYPNSYIYNTHANFTITRIRTTLNQNINVGDVIPVLNVTDSSQIPDGNGYLIFNFGRNNQEQPVKYIARPNNSTLLLDPTYIFQKAHNSGEVIGLLASIHPYRPRKNGQDYAAYITGTVEALNVVKSIIAKIKASGVILRWIVDYPKYNFTC